MKTKLAVISFIIFFLSPLVFNAIGASAATKMGFVCTIMGLWWLAHLIPLAATALFPLVACPYLNICSTKILAPKYMNSIIVIFIGGFLMADAISKTNLHTKFALKIVKIVGRSEKLLVLGFMLVAGFLSMMISNTATTLMVYTISMALLTNTDEQEGNLHALLPLAIAYSASIGGMGTLLGTPPNLIFAQVIDSEFAGAYNVSYFEWVLWGVPLAIALLFFGWLLLTNVFLKKKSTESFTKLKDSLLSQEKQNQHTTREQKWVLLFFTLLVLAWTFRKNIVIGDFSIPGWASLIGSGSKFDDGTVSLLMVFPLFFINFNEKEKIINLSSIKNIPWDTLILFGGGFAMAEGMRVSGLAGQMGQYLLNFANISPLTLLTSITTGMTFLTEFTSNTASSQIFLPILAIASKSLNIHPYILMVPTTMAASLAFMLPAATAPNAIAFASGKVPLRLMIKVGFCFNILGLILVNILGLIIYATN